jgi:hypothetical protein
MADLDLGPGYRASAAVLTFRPVRFAVVEATIH